MPIRFTPVGKGALRASEPAAVRCSAAFLALVVSFWALSTTGLAAEAIPDLVISDFESLDGWQGLELDAP